MKKLIMLLFVAIFSLNAINAQTAVTTPTTPATPQSIKTEKEKKKEKKNKKSNVADNVEVAPISADPSIFIGSDAVDYGTIAKGADPVRNLEVVNKGAKPLLITNCSGSCGCTVPTCPREPILPGKSASIQIKYDTNRVGPINKSVTIVSNDPKTPTKTVMVKGTVTE